MPVSKGATIINGNELAESIRKDLAVRIETTRKTRPDFQPVLAVVLDRHQNPNADRFYELKAKVGNAVGIMVERVDMPEKASIDVVIQEIRKLNEDDRISGILVQLPLGGHITMDDERTIIEAVSPEKDINGIHSHHIGMYSVRAPRPLVVPCAALAVIAVLESINISIAGLNAVVLGRSDISGGQAALMLRNHDATVTQCHSKTRNIDEIVKRADIVVAAIGKPEFVKGSWIKPGAIVIDFGTNYIPDATKRSGFRMVGDVEFGSASANASYITPVPGGLGPITISMMFRNTFLAAERMWNKRHEIKVDPPKYSVRAFLGSYGLGVWNYFMGTKRYSVSAELS
ncbi:hypothetical protein AMATHDRAFT_67483 [Amanita thiersii Skay4041]|uniref:Methenyltetrahydrofolate cyclohydrolase n=1 Tax=Amanita thiersii Skay4041 TaxID=703135 RepID=A0A2A9NIM2_9AGAR|nr:hypothetical protein AMATHDRAFT_67483 [Amanita thiersii Skay4041]